MIRRSLTRLVGPVAFSMTPAMYGLETNQEMMERTMIGGAIGVALNVADAIMALYGAKPK